MDIIGLSVVEIMRGLKERQFSAREVVEAYLSEISARDKDLHSYLFLNSEAAKDTAAAIDAAIERGDAMGPLGGVPIAVKDNIVVADWPATGGSKILESYVGAYEATVVSRLRSAGAVLLGKTNLDEFAMGSSTENSAFGVTKNPHDLRRVPGGSSGGSAAAVSAKLSLLALGSDTGGSIRQPAAFTGVVGIKPTYGRISRHGLMAMASSLDQIGPLGRTVSDAAALYQVIAGHDPYDATSAKEPVSPLDHRDSLQGVRIGVPREYFIKGLDARIEASVRSALKKFEGAGATLVDISLPHSPYALSCYYIIVPAEVSANVARYDGLRYGFVSQEAKNLLHLYKNTRDEGFGPEVKRRIMIGTYVLSHGYYDAYYAKAQKVRRLIRSDFENAFTNVDVIMGPTTPSLPFKFGEKSDPVSMYLEDVYTVPVNLAGIPALSMPCGTLVEEGAALPVGLQVIGSWFDEARLLGIADACEHILEPSR